jgi:hypothetical protein
MLYCCAVALVLRRRLLLLLLLCCISCAAVTGRSPEQVAHWQRPGLTWPHPGDTAAHGAVRVQGVGTGVCA